MRTGRRRRCGLISAGGRSWLSLGARATPEVVFQSLDRKRGRIDGPMSVRAAGHRWRLTSRRGEFYMEGRLPLAEGVREELLGAGELSLDAPNLPARVVAPNGSAFRRGVSDCRRARQPAHVEIAPAQAPPR